jgi:hypothetical protein
MFLYRYAGRMSVIPPVLLYTFLLLIGFLCTVRDPTDCCMTLRAFNRIRLLGSVLMSDQFGLLDLTSFVTLDYVLFDSRTNFTA